jgi:hypothetical protein
MEVGRLRDDRPGDQTRIEEDIRKIIICGDRNWKDEYVISKFLDTLVPEKNTTIHRDRRGADRMAGDMAEERGFLVIPFPADWKQFGRAAGPMRNEKMLNQEPDFVVAFHEDLRKSKGTRDMIQKAKDAGIAILLLPTREDPDYNEEEGELI